jgi:hypothetical protein
MRLLTALDVQLFSSAAYSFVVAAVIGLFDPGDRSPDGGRGSPSTRRIGKSIM